MSPTFHAIELRAAIMLIQIRRLRGLLAPAQGYVEMLESLRASLYKSDMSDVNVKELADAPKSHRASVVEQE